MSKRMMKRSLALGALMAFVITGSAIAAEITAGGPATGGKHGLGNGDGFVMGVESNAIINEDVLKITVNDENGYGNKRDYSGIIVNGDKNMLTQPQITINVNDLEINGATASAINTLQNGKLTVNAEERVYINSYGHGINSGAQTDSKITINAVDAAVTIIAGENAVDARSTTSDNAETKSGIEITGKTITIESTNKGVQSDDKGHAVVARGKGAQVNITASDSLTVTAIKNKNAVYATGNNSEITLDGGKETVITGTVQAGTNGAANGKIDVAIKGESITVDANKGSYGVVAWGDTTNKGDDITIELGDGNTKTIDIKNFTYAGILAGYDDTVIEIEASSLNVIGEGVGIWAANGTYSTSAVDNDSIKSKINIGKDTVTYVNITGTDSYAICAMSEGIVNIQGDLTAIADNAVAARGDAIVKINADEKGESLGSTVVLDGDVRFDYDGSNSRTPVNAEVTINLDGEGASWTGNTTIFKDDNEITNIIMDENGNIIGNEDANNFTITDFTLGVIDGATWTTDANSFVNNLNLDNGIVNMTGTGTGDKAQQVLVGTATGDGTVTTTSLENKMTINDASDLSDLAVRATGDLADSIAALTGTEQEEQLNALTGVVTTGENATTVATTVGTTEGEIAGAITAQVDENGQVVASSIKEATNTTNQAIGEAAVALKAHWRAHMNDMNKRMGELRMANGEAGVWTRMVRGEAEYEGAKAQYNQYQLGYDEKLSVDKRWTVGAAVTFAEGEGSYGKGTTEDDSTAFAIYGSKLNNDGTFVDLIARYARVESDVTSYTGNTGDYSTNGYSVSAEFGKRIQQGNGLWIEPQVELTYGTIDSADYKLDGKDVHVGDMDSLIGRVGFSLGKDIKQGNVYARASYLYDFDGETETTFSANGLTRTIEQDLGGGWWEVGVGANINLSKATYIYADVEKTFGGEVDTNWQWNLGVRYSF